MPEWIAIVILGIVEGITEFLPISSTGHLLLVQHLPGIARQSDLFNVVIQAGAARERRDPGRNIRCRTACPQAFPVIPSLRR